MDNAEIELINFFFGSQRRLTNILRWNTTPRICSDSVASHSYFVSLYSMIIADYLENRYKYKIDKEKVIRFALLHDIEECFSGDIVASIKASSQEFRESLEKLNFKVLEVVFKNLSNKKEYIDNWKESRKYDCLESLIVRVSDIISQILYSFEELKMGNSFMQEIFESSLQRLRFFKEEWVQNFLNEIIIFTSKNLDISFSETRAFSHEIIKGEDY